MGIWPIRFYPITVNDWTMRESGFWELFSVYLCCFSPDELLSLYECSLSGFLLLFEPLVKI